MSTPKSKKITILAIESSCDETAAAILTGQIGSSAPKYQLRSSIIKSQIATHRKTGGVVPEVAARAHLANILPVTVKALAEAKTNLKNIDYIAVTSGPGLVVSLIVGVEFAKALALATNKPLLPTNHMAGHLYSSFADRPEKIKFPALALVVSGGHTMLLLMKDYYNYKVIGQTLDDAAGEAFDKVARMLDLPYPGGPSISKLGLQGKNIINFPRPMIHEANFNFSFSGLKTAVLYFLEKNKQPLTKQKKADISMSFEMAAVDVLVQKTIKAAKKYQCQTIALAGGVAANQRLRHALQETAKQEKIEFTMPPFSLCTDNAGMIAIAAYMNLRNGQKPRAIEKVQANPNWELK